MSWHGILGHDRVVEQFRRAIQRGRLATSFLFVGPEGVGKRTFALRLAQALLCHERPESAMDPCGRCPACVQVNAGTHPDLELVSKPADKSFLPLELLIGDKEHRMREGLCHNLGMKPLMGRRKVAIIDDADYLNEEGANSLLKTLEEPPPRSVLILVGTSPAKQLPTIRSRCQLVRFHPLPPETVAQLLLAQGLVADAEKAARLAQSCGGSLRRAAVLAEDELWEFRTRLYEVLASPRLDSPRLARAVTTLVDAAGKEAPRRRARLREVFVLAAEFYRQLMRARAQTPRFGQAAEAGGEGTPANLPGDLETATACLDRCLDALEQTDRNTNQTTLIECWADDLAVLQRGEGPARMPFSSIGG
ncbi:MAG: DNA polymerase III subunit delta' [Thermoguttaceae bacterium]|jgi:DNA polymerase-3 subunit delta'|nr:DNA polymerase III subunit delta' [Thermoguttaceae bacterium]